MKTRYGRRVVEVVAPDGEVHDYEITAAIPHRPETRAWLVTSPDWTPDEPEKGRYRVSESAAGWNCQCKDWEKRHRWFRKGGPSAPCKHMAPIVRMLAEAGHGAPLDTRPGEGHPEQAGGRRVPAAEGPDPLPADRGGAVPRADGGQPRVPGVDGRGRGGLPRVDGAAAPLAEGKTG